MANETVENTNVKEVKLKVPKTFDGHEVTKIVLDFNNMTGDDVMKVDKELREEGYPYGFDTIWNQNAVLKLAARAAKMLPEDIKKLHAGDYMEVTFQTRNFFVGW